MNILTDADDPTIMLVQPDRPADHIVLTFTIEGNDTMPKPSIKQPRSQVRPKTVPLHVRARLMVEQLYQRSGAGCCLHIITDDFNVQDQHAAFCLDYAEKQGHRQCYELAKLFIHMSPKERAQTLGLPWCPQCHDVKDRWQADCCGKCHECGTELEQPREELM